MSVIGFDEKVTFRIIEEQKIKAEKIINDNPDIYDNISHFARSWFIRGLRNYEQINK